MTYTLGFSPCPNDTFIFDALVNKKIDTEGFHFEAILEDVQTLNEWALEQRLDISKISYGVLPMVMDNYALLNSGSALGTGVGPLLITSKACRDFDINAQRIAIPGKNTTAHLLFSLAYPGAKNKVFLRYDEIENYVLENNGPGVIIHENRFTYQQKGLLKICDLGDYWEQQTGNPIPLGGIVINKKISRSIQHTIDSLIKKSIEHAFSNHPVLNDYIRIHAQEMSEEVMLNHINLYVNAYSLDLGEKGINAVKKLISVFNDINAMDVKVEGILVGS